MRRAVRAEYQRRNLGIDSYVVRVGSARYYAGGDAAAQRPYHGGAFKMRP